ncbi:hypothetical protein SISNIDRAFT_470644 [Sistotremastrum niveocremeum HHB9708]|uniref:Uncharacterized protein n=1 Tax=Sistotremastrum niveocremeum HHB9708 TaxID=1314777 RepID=A0A164NP70_9AGAM|nr:hypothetical protein SISNIDRAFT_470644 [Sistotremastrum niveocremeum HHB9708]
MSRRLCKCSICSQETVKDELTGLLVSGAYVSSATYRSHHEFPLEIKPDADGGDGTDRSPKRLLPQPDSQESIAELPEPVTQQGAKRRSPPHVVSTSKKINDKGLVSPSRIRGPRHATHISSDQPHGQKADVSNVDSPSTTLARQLEHITITFEKPRTLVFATPPTPGRRYVPTSVDGILNHGPSRLDSQAAENQSLMSFEGSLFHIRGHADTLGLTASLRLKRELSWIKSCVDGELKQVDRLKHREWKRQQSLPRAIIEPRTKSLGSIDMAVGVVQSGRKATYDIPYPLA